MDDPRPRVHRYDVVRIAAGPGDMRGELGVVTALRSDAQTGWWYAVYICSDDVGLGCPNGQMKGFRDAEVIPTGRTALPFYSIDGGWPPPSQPKFQLHESVRLVSGGGNEPGQAGVIHWPPEYYQARGWLYTVLVTAPTGQTVEAERLLVVPESGLESAGEWSESYWAELQNPPGLGEGEKVYITRRGEDSGKLGVVIGKAQESDGRWRYDVLPYGEEEEGGMFEEDELRGTGEFDQLDWLYTGEHLRVAVDEETGEGRITGMYSDDPPREGSDGA